MARGKEGRERERETELERRRGLPTTEIGGDLVATKTRKTTTGEGHRRRRVGRTDRWMGCSSCRGVAHSNHSIDLSPLTQKGQKRHAGEEGTYS